MLRPAPSLSVCLLHLPVLRVACRRRCQRYEAFLCFLLGALVGLSTPHCFPAVYRTSQAEQGQRPMCHSTTMLLTAATRP